MTDIVVTPTLLDRVNEIPLRSKLSTGMRGCLAFLAAQQGTGLCTDISNKALGAELGSPTTPWTSTSAIWWRWA